MNFLDMQKSVQDVIGNTSATNLVIIKRELNRAVDDIMQRGLFRFSIRQTTLSTTSDVSDYYFPSDFGKSISLTTRDGDYQLSKIWVGDFEGLYPDPSAHSNGEPKLYMELLNDRVLAQPTAAAKVALVSDSNQDLAGLTGASYATLYGVVGGVDRSEQVALSAQNFVSSSSSFSKLYSITLNLSAAGNLVAYQATVGTVLLRLYPGETEREYKKFKLFPTPDGTYTIYLTYQAQSLPMVNDSDTCLVPSKYHQVLVDKVIGRMMLFQGDQKAEAYVRLSENGITRMVADEDMEWDYVSGIKYPRVLNPYSADYPFAIQ